MNLKTILTAIIALFSMNVMAESCFQITQKDIELKWTAFKTPSKAGVGGTFSKIQLSGELKGKTIANVVEKTTFEIDAKSVNTNNPERDGKLVANIFNTIKGKKIAGKFTKMAKDTLTVQITMNGVTKEVPMSFKLNNNAIMANGYIDMFDFTMQPQVAAINKACYELHEGKTWSDVALTVLAKFTPCKK